MQHGLSILITGIPGIGKTILIKNLFDALKEFNPAGLYTAETRKDGIRKGFELVSLDGKMTLLSHTNIRSLYRVGKYGVDVQGFEAFLDGLPFLGPTTRLIIIDEIGKMECLSDKFRKLIKQLFDSEKPVIATITIKGTGLITEIKDRTDIRLIEIRQDNRNIILSKIINNIKT